jgi:hypothetical protein
VEDIVDLPHSREFEPERGSKDNLSDLKGSISPGHKFSRGVCGV